MQRNGTRTQKTTMASTIGKYTGKNMQRDVKWREMARYFSFHFIHGMCEPGSVCSNDDVPFFQRFLFSLSLDSPCTLVCWQFFVSSTVLVRVMFFCKLNELT